MIEGEHMKRISEKELMVGIIFILLFLFFGFETLKEIVTSMKYLGIDLFEILLAKHITWYIVKGILATLAGFGVWLGSPKAKLLFSGILFIVTISFF